MNSVLKGSKFRHIFGTDLVTPQNIIFNSMINLDYAAFRLPRGSGKDFLLDAYAMLYTSSIPKSTVLITAPTYTQAKISFRGLERFSLNTYFGDLLLKRPIIASNMCYLKFKNGSQIDARALDNLGVKYAINSDVVLVTEAASIPKEQLSKLVSNVENNVFKKVFLMSTGYYDYNYMNEIEAHEYFSTLAFGYKAFPTEFFDQANIDDVKKTISADVFDMEYNSKICK
jgi:hypothetical protein